MPLTLQPDPETLIVAALAAQSSVTAITPRIGTRLSGTYPAVRVTEVVSVPQGEGGWFVVYQVECWADDDVTASLLARTVEACRLDLRRQTAGGWFALSDVTSVTPGYDEDSQRSRYDVSLEGTVGA